MGSNFVGSTETLDEEIERFSCLARFLEENGLTTRRLANENGAVSDGFMLRVGDLTPEGFAVMKAGYYRWLGSVDRTKNSRNIRILSNALAKLKR
jgi:hypothetical protein